MPYGLAEPSWRRAGPGGDLGQEGRVQESYAYSPALKNSGIVWDEQTLDRCMQGATHVIAGTRMVVALPDYEMRRAVIAYLQPLQ